MNAKILLANALGIIAALATTSAALADSGTASDQNLRFARAYVEHAVDMLSHDQADYGGHKATAIDDLNTARTDLTAALKFDKNPDDAIIPSGARPEDTDIATILRGQGASNRNIEYTKTVVERTIDMLQRDAHDYGGFRVKAIAALESARDQLAEALEFRAAHPENGESMSTASDENLRFSRLYLQRAVNMLQHDQRDYGGHRAKAVTDIQAAQEDLASALAHDANREDSVIPTTVMKGDEDLDAFFMRGQFASNENIEFARRYVERAIDMLQADQHDYAGFRVKAIADLENARHQLLLAINFVNG